MNKEIYRLNDLEIYSNNFFTSYYIFINLPIWTTFYTFDGLISIYITFERIQIVMNKYGFIRRNSVKFNLNILIR